MEGTQPCTSPLNMDTRMYLIFLWGLTMQMLILGNCLLISEKVALPTIPTQQGQTVYIVVPIYFVIENLSGSKIIFFITKLI